MSPTTLRTLLLGEGPPVVILHGYGLSPFSYRGTAELLAWRTRVAVPAIFALHGRWSYERALQALLATLDSLELDQVTLIGHSFGGGLELGLAARYPERVVELVFADTLGMSREWMLAEEAVRPMTLFRLATPTAAVDFTHSWLSHPMQMVRAAWWGFVSDRRQEVATIARAGLPLPRAVGKPRHPAQPPGRSRVCAGSRRLVHGRQPTRRCRTRGPRLDVPLPGPFRRVPGQAGPGRPVGDLADLARAHQRGAGGLDGAPRVAALEVVVDQPERLHGSVDRRRADEAKPAAP